MVSVRDIKNIRSAYREELQRRNIPFSEKQLSVLESILISELAPEDHRVKTLIQWRLLENLFEGTARTNGSHSRLKRAIQEAGIHSEETLLSHYLDVVRACGDRLDTDALADAPVGLGMKSFVYIEAYLSKRELIDEKPLARLYGKTC